jgi:FkbM family methyltransferase
MQSLKTKVAKLLPYGLVNAIKRRSQERSETESRRHFYQRFVKPGDIVFDVGANRGNRVAAFLKLGAIVHAFEPQPHCATLLTSRYAARKSVTIHQIAVGDQDGDAEMFVAPNVDVLSSMSRKFIDTVTESGRFGATKWSSTIMVKVKTLDSLIAAHGVPAFVKIDVEGYEPQVLSGLSRVVPALSIEWTPELSDNAQQCITRLSSLGFAYYNISFGESMEMLDNWVSHEEILTITQCLRNAKSLFGDIYASTAAR